VKNGKKNPKKIQSKKTEEEGKCGKEVGGSTKKQRRMRHHKKKKGLRKLTNPGIRKRRPAKFTSKEGEGPEEKGGGGGNP